MRFLARTFCLGALMLACIGLAPVAAAKTIVVIAPHPDDEALIAAGTVRAAILANDIVKIVVVTNGDFSGVQTGLQRQVESVNSAGVLGLAEQHVIFLGYPDGALGQIYNAPTPTTVITSNAGQTQTYGNRGWNNTDYHRGRFGSPGAYNRVTMEQDLRTLLGELQPDEVYTVSHFDSHGDHAITAILVAEALAALKRSGTLPATRLHQGIVWAPGQETVWPDEAGGCSPNTPFPPPQIQTPHEWKRTLRATVLANLKCQAIGAFSSQATPHLLSYARKNEFFWVSDFGANLALTAQVTASSESVSQGRMRAVDGIVDGAHHDAAREWVSASQLAGAWIQLDWPAPASVAQVNLHGRPLAGENLLAGTLSFSDGSSIAVGALPAGGRLLPVTFAPKSVSWVRFTVDQAQGASAGLSEIQVLGVPLAQAGTNVAPHFIEGPGGDNDAAILSSETATFSVQAHDLNGDALQYEWSADGGTIQPQGSGASAVFTPPSVSGSTVFTITARILDGRGGSATSVAFATVSPAADALTLSPTVVPGGNSAQGTVTLASPASGGGLSVPLSSSQPAVAGVPSSVTVPSGSASATFPVSTAAVSSRAEVTISASIHGTPRTAVLAVTPPPAPVPPGNLLLSPDSIGDGNWLNLGPIRSTPGFAAAPDGTQNGSRVETTAQGGHALAQVVNVAASAAYTFSFQARNNGGSAAAYSVHCAALGTDIVPATSYIGSINGSGWTQMSVPFTTPAGCNQVVVYPLRDSGTPVDVLLWRALLVPGSVPPPASLASLDVSPSSVTGGGSATGTATLSAAAPAGGAQVSLSSDNPAVTVPASVTVAAGATSATFSVTTGAVATTTSATITGSSGGATRTASLTVTPATVLSSLSASPASVTGGSAATGTATLSAPAPAGGAVVQLSDDSGATSVPASVTVPAGATSATFSIGTSPVAASTTATITGSYGGATRTASLTVVPPAVSTLDVSPASVTGGAGATGTVTLNAPAPSGGAVVQLSDDSTAASVPASVTVAAGATSATFSIGTSAVAASTTVTISASFGGATRTDTLVVQPASLVSLTLNPTSVVGGPLLGNSTGTVTLNGPAPAGGAVVALSDNSAACDRPGSVTIPAGATSASFTVTTSIVLMATTCTVTGTYQGTNRSANLEILL